jgi:hypothetical protein
MVIYSLLLNIMICSISVNESFHYMSQRQLTNSWTMFCMVAVGRRTQRVPPFLRAYFQLTNQGYPLAIKMSSIKQELWVYLDQRDCSRKTSTSVTPQGNDGNKPGPACSKRQHQLVRPPMGKRNSTGRSEAVASDEDDDYWREAVVHEEASVKEDSLENAEGPENDERGSEAEHSADVREERDRMERERLERETGEREASGECHPISSPIPRTE